MLYSKLQSYALMADWTRRESIEKVQETIFFFARKPTSFLFYCFAFFKGLMSTIYVALTRTGSINILACDLGVENCSIRTVVTTLPYLVD